MEGSLMGFDFEHRPAIARCDWNMAVDPGVIPAVTTMLSDSELRMLHWLARNMPRPPGACIVDAGCFLGGSTVALASGGRSGGHPTPIHSYDMFLAPNDAYSQRLIGNRSVGASVFDLYEANVAPWRDLVTPHVGDFMTAPPPDEAIALLFVDLTKTWELNDRMVQQYFPKLIPGASIVIQQDHNDHSCPWANITMEYYSSSFEYLGDDSSSRIFLCTAPVEVDPRPLLDSLPLSEMLALLRRAADRSRHPVPAYMCLVTGAWVVFEFEGAEAAIAYLDALPPQPWEASEPYVDQLRRAFRKLGDAAGLRRYSKKYFSPSNVN